MSTSVIHPNTIQIRPSRLTGLVVGVAILTGVTTWSVSQVTTESNASNSPKPEVASAPSAASKAYFDGVVALDAEQRVAIYGIFASTPQSVQSVNAHSPELQAIDVAATPQSVQSVVDLKAIAEMARAEGLTGLSPASLGSPTRQSVQSVNAHSPELQTVNVSPTQQYPDAIAALPREQLVATFGTFS